MCEFGGQYTPVHLAVLGCHSRALRTLLEGSASAAALDQYGNTPLYCAARQLSPECVQVRTVKIACFHPGARWRWRHASNHQRGVGAPLLARHRTKCSSNSPHRCGPDCCWSGSVWPRAFPQVLLELGGGQQVGLDLKNQENETPMMAALMALHQVRRHADPPTPPLLSPGRA